MRERTVNLRGMCALLAALAACGGDDDKSESRLDGGSDAGVGGDIDAGIDASHLDASTLFDASARSDAGADALAAALDQAGVHTDAARATLVFSAYCPRNSACTPGSSADDTTSCLQSADMAYQALRDAGASDACLDATLDLYACEAALSCDAFADGCPDATGAYTAACPPPP